MADGREAEKCGFCGRPMRWLLPSMLNMQNPSDEVWGCDHCKVEWERNADTTDQEENSTRG